MLNAMIKRIIAMILSTMMVFTSTSGVVQNNNTDVVDATVSTTETSDTVLNPELFPNGEDEIYIIPSEDEKNDDSYIVEIDPGTQETTPEKENDNGAMKPSDDEHKTTVTYDPTEEDINNKEENKKEEQKQEETKPVVAPTEPKPEEPKKEETKPTEPTITFADVNETVYATSGVNVRKGPSTDYEKIGSLNKNDAVKRIGVGSNGWSKIEYNGKTAYVSSSYLTTTKPVVETQKQEEQKPAVDNRDKVTMIDLNTIYLDNVSYWKNVGTIEDYIKRCTIAKVEMPAEFKEAEALFLNALNNGDATFEYMFPAYPKDFGNNIVVNHLSYGSQKATLYSSSKRQSDGTYLFTADLVKTRESIADAQNKWNNLVAKQEKVIADKLAHNAELDRLNEVYRQKVYECVIAAGVTKGMAVEDAIVKIHDYICKINTYDYTYTYYHFDDIFNHGTSVCNGYAGLFFLMAQRCGIDVEMVSSAKMNHIWNVVHFDGKTLYVDTTWTDTGSNRYCLVTKSQMSKHNFSDIEIKDSLHIVYN